MDNRGKTQHQLSENELIAHQSSSSHFANGGVSAFSAIGEAIRKEASFVVL